MNSETILAPIRVRPAVEPAAAGLVVVVQVRSAGQEDKAQPPGRRGRALSAGSARLIHRTRHMVELRRCHQRAE
jgi:hypothetical protein